jgi:hypothetical protein
MPAPTPAKDDRRFYVFGIKALGTMTALIAVPAVAASLVGNWLDGRFGTRPYGLVVSMALGFAITAFMAWGESRRLGKEYQGLVTPKDNPPQL